MPRRKAAKRPRRPSPVVIVAGDTPSRTTAAIRALSSRLPRVDVRSRSAAFKTSTDAGNIVGVVVSEASQSAETIAAEIEARFPEASIVVVARDPQADGGTRRHPIKWDGGSLPHDRIAAAVSGVISRVSVGRDAATHVVDERDGVAALFDEIPIAMFAQARIDGKTRVVGANMAACRLFGYDPREFDGLSIERLLSEREGARFEAFEEDYASSPRSMSAEFLCVRKDGTEFQARVHLGERSRSAGAFVVAVEDISDRRSAEDVSRRAIESLRQERGMFVTGPVVAFKWQNREGWPVEYVSPNVADVFGYTADEFMTAAVSYAAVVFAGDLDRVAGEVRKYSDGGVARFRHEPYRIVRKDGRVIWVDDYTTVLRDAHGAITHYLGYVVDITERVDTQQALRESEDRYRQFYLTTLVGVWRTRLDDGLLLSCNDAAARLFGFPDARSAVSSGLRTPDLYDPTDRTKLLELLHRDGAVRDFPIEQHCVDGATRRVEITARMYHEPGMIEGTVVDATARIEAQEALRRSEERFRALFEDAPLAVFEQGLAGGAACVLRANRAACLMYGYKPDEFEGMPIGRLIPPTAMTDFDVLRAAYESGRHGLSLESFNVRADGTVFPVRVHLGTSDPDTGRVTVTVEDITEQQRTMDALAESEQRFRHFYETALVGLWRTRVGDGVLLSCNETAARMLGFESRAEALASGISIADLYDETMTAELYDRLRRDGATEQLDLDLKRIDGKVIRVEITARLDAHGGFVEGTVLDVSARVEAQRALKEREERFRALFEDAPLAVFEQDVLDGVPTILRANRAACAMYGYSSEEFADMPVARVASGEPQDTVAHRIAARDDSRPTSFEWFNRRADGSVFPVRVHVSARYFGKPGHVIITVEDVSEQRKAQQLLQQREREVSALLDSLPGFAFLKSADSVYITANDVFCKAMGRSKEEMIGTTDFDHLPPEIASKYREQDLKVITTGETLSMSVDTVVRDGRRITVATRKVPLKSENGAVMGLIGLGFDITELKHAEEALRESERVLATLMSNLPGMAYRSRVDGRWTKEFISEGCYNVTGYRPDEMMGDGSVSMEDLIHPDDRALVRAAVESAVAEQRPFEYVYRITSKGGSLRWLWERGRGVYDGQGDLKWIEGFVADVTERRQAEEQVADWKQRYELVVASSGQIVYDYDLTSGAIIWSGGIESVLGYTLEQMSGGIDQWTALIHPDDAPEALRVLEECESNGAPYDMDYRFQRKDGEYVWIHDKGFFVMDADGRPVRMLGMMQDVTSSKRAEAALREAHRRTEAIIANVPGVVYRSAIIGEGRLRTMFLSAAFEALSGYVVESFLRDGGPTFSDLIFPADFRRVWGEIQSALEARQPFSCRYRIMTAGNKIKWVYDEGRGVYDDDGSLIALEGVMLDDTAHVEVEQAREALTAELRERSAELERNRAFLSRLLEVSSMLPAAVSVEQALELAARAVVDSRAFDRALVVLSDAEPYVVYSSHAAAAQPEEDESSHAGRLERLADYVLSLDREELRGGGMISLPLKASHGSGGTARQNGAAAESSFAFVLRDTDGSPIGCLLADEPAGGRVPSKDTAEAVQLFLDLTSAVIARKRLESRLSDLLSTIPDVVFRTDAEGSIRFAGGGVAALLGYRPEQLLGRNLSALCASDPIAFRDAFQAARSSGSGWAGELRFARSDGPLRHFLVSLRTTADGGAVAIARDNEERRTIQTQLYEAQRMESLGLLAGGVAHDFNNLLAVIMGAASLLEVRLDDTKDRRHLAAILESSQRAADLTSQLLAFSRRTPDAEMACDPTAAARSAANLLRRGLPQGVKVVLDAPAGLPRARVEKGQLQQVIMNLAINGALAMPDGGTLTISCRKATSDETEANPALAGGEHLAVVVDDTGIGMAEGVRRRIYEPFFTTRDPGRGTGLGLSIVYGIVTSHGGHIDLRTAPGEGTTFTVYFPVAKEKVAVERQLDAVPVGSGQKVLVVDDQHDVAEVAAGLVESLGYRALVAHSAERALEVIKDEGDVAAVVADYAMPGMNGLELAERAHTIEPRLPILMSSGLGVRLADETRVRGVFSGFIHKPYSAAVLARELHRIIAERDKDGAGG